MKITIEVVAGNHYGDPTAADVDENIAAIDRAISGKKTGMDDSLLLDTRSLLENVREQLQ